MPLTQQQKHALFEIRLGRCDMYPVSRCGKAETYAVLTGQQLFLTRTRAHTLFEF